ncbi:MAG: PucR family transcriptional regulator ligand-binding domain-containing protein [Lachnospiraceae bacterium]|nr:PucR family transcriptional regulator ligand-binding domain-containing protein [Candidatus Equihabitans merdae]
MEVTIEDLLRIPMLHHPQLIAGNSHMDNHVRKLSSIDSFDGGDYVEPYTLAVTSGYFLATDVLKACSLLLTLKDKGVSGITLKEGFFSKEDLATITETADNLGLPVILLDEGMHFSSFFDYFNKYVYCNGIETFLSRDHILALMLRELNTKGLKGLANMVNYWTGKPTCIALENHLYRCPDNDLSNPNYFDGKTLSISFGNEVEAVLSIKRYDTDDAPNLNDEAILSIAKLACEADPYLLMSFSDKGRAELQENFVRDLLTGKNSALTQGNAQYTQFETLVPSSLRVIAVEGMSHHRTVNDCKQLELLLGQLSEPLLKCRIDNTVAFIIPAELGDINYLRSLIKSHPAIDAEELRIGIGNEVDAVNASASYYQALQVLNIADQEAAEDLRSISDIIEYQGNGDDPGNVYFYQDLGFYTLMGTREISPKVESLCDRYILPLIEYEKKSDVPLIETLKVFFKSHQNFSKTGNALFIHGNTVHYRLEQIEKLCRISFDNYYDTLNLQLALAYMPYVYPDVEPNHEAN